MIAVEEKPVTSLPKTASSDAVARRLTSLADDYGKTNDPQHQAAIEEEFHKVLFEQ